MALINGKFVLDNVQIRINNESVVNLSNECVIIQYVFDVCIRVHVMIGHMFELKLNNVIITNDMNLISLIRDNDDKFNIVYDDENFIEFVIHSAFQYIKYENEHIHAQMKICKMLD